MFTLIILVLKWNQREEKMLNIFRVKCLELEQVLIRGVGSTKLNLEVRYNYLIAKESILNGDFVEIVDLSRNNDKLAMEDINFNLKASGVERVEGTLILDYSNDQGLDVYNFLIKLL
ncbi:hypothetical protein LUV35_00070 [Vibrio cholerae]|uniref:hypothetical protein n=1 Tax=Vibrio cholerae TaxID=666 RepID=UPI001E657F50|nr:hypothetical protein [Vibrio cholerae]MCD9209384.1 hypothetical protein [Vibrio cholerae]